jgi:hypothetical protein
MKHDGRSFLQTWAAPGLFTVYFFIFGLGLVPTALLLLRTKIFVARWLASPPPKMDEALSPRPPWVERTDYLTRSSLKLASEPGDKSCIRILRQSRAL